MIKIDMDMPRSCSRCPFEVYDEDENDYYFCSYTDAEVSQMVDCRHDRCPLIEEPRLPGRPHGHWKKVSNAYSCSICSWLKNYTPCYCENCGAYMKEGD